MTADSKTYVRAAMALYAHTPNVIAPRPADRRLAADLFARAVPLATIEAALLLASARRLYRSPDRAALPAVRSFAYFMPVIQEIIDQPLPQNYVDYLRYKVSAFPTH